MKSILILLPLLFLGAFASAQCPELSLSQLHTMQRAEYSEKNQVIRNQGFDLRSQFTQPGASIASYSKCWNSNFRDRSIFEQLIWWNSSDNSIIFMTLKESHFLSLRDQILDRQPGGRKAENPDFYLGKMFKYRFGARRVDEAEYYFVHISFR